MKYPFPTECSDAALIPQTFGLRTAPLPARRKLKGLKDPGYAGIEPLEARYVLSGAGLVAITAGSKTSFVDADGDEFEVRLKGSGSVSVELDDPNGTGRGSILALTLLGTTDASALEIAVKKVVGDGEVSIGSVGGDGSLKSFSAPKSDLVGAGINLVGTISTIELSDARNGADIVLSGVLSKPIKLKLGQVGVGTDIQSGTPISSITAAAVASGSWTAPSFGKVTVTGGSFGATLQATASAAVLGNTPGLLGLSVTGGDFTGQVHTLGDIGAITVKSGKSGGGAIVGATIAADSLGNLSSSGGLAADITLSGGLKSLAAKGNASGAWTAATFDKIAISGGNLSADIVALANPAEGGNGFGVKSLTVAGGDFTGSIGAVAQIGKITVKEAKNVGGSIDGALITAPTIASVSVSNQLDESIILAGVKLGTDGALGGTGAAADTFGPGLIGKFSVGGNVTESTVGSGLVSADSEFGNEDDELLGGAGSEIKSFTIKGAATTSFFAAAILPKKVKIGGATIDAPNDARFLTTGTPDGKKPTLSATLAHDTGISGSDGLTSDITIAGVADDNLGVTFLQAQLGAGAPLNITGVLGSDGKFTLTPALLQTINGGPIADGAHTLQITAKDSVGNVRVFDLTFALDATAPTLLDVAPGEGSSLGQGEQELVVRFSEAIDPATAVAANFRLLDATGSSIPIASLALDATGKQVLITTSPLGEGAYRLVVNVDAIKDRAGTPATGADLSVNFAVQSSGKSIFSGTRFAELGTGPQILLTGDLDGDGDLDVITGNTPVYDAYLGVYLNTLSVALNNGNGTFVNGATYSLPGTAYELAMADLDGDGDMDVTVRYGERDYDGYISNRGVAVLLGAGRGTLEDSLVVATEVEDENGQLVLPAYVLGDFDSDGDLDVLRSGGVYNEETGDEDRGVLALFGNAAGGFEAPVLLRDFGGFATAIASGDLDGDGDLDLTLGYSVTDPVTYDSNPALQVLLSNGDGTFADATPIVQFARVINSLQLADLDGDGDLDTLAVQSGYNPATYDYDTTVHVFRNDGDGGLSGSGAPLALGQAGFKLADLDADGDLDILATRAIYDDASYDFKLGAKAFLQGANGTFVPKAEFIGAGYGKVDLADMDGDADLDLVVTHSNFYTGESSISVLLNVGASFVEANTLQLDSGFRGVTLKDINGDGNTDLLVNSGATFSVFRNTGSGLFSVGDRRDYVAPKNNELTALGDFDNDGDLDLASVGSALLYDPYQGDFTRSNGRLVIVHGESQGLFDAPHFAELGKAPEVLLTGDVDADGDLDLISGNAGVYDEELGATVGSLSVALNHGDGNFASGVRYTVSGQIAEMSLADLDGDGDLDLTVRSGDPSYYGYVTNQVVSVLLGVGDGTFENALVVAREIEDQFGNQVLSPYLLGDFNSDGNLDVLRSGGITNPVTGEDILGVVALFGNDVGGLKTPVIFHTLDALATSLAAGDLDEDGDLDIAVGYSSYNPTTYEYDSVLRVLIGSGAGVFTPGAPITGFDGALNALQLADIDADGDLDVLAVQTSYNPVTYLYDTKLRVLSNDGAGALSPGGTVNARDGSYRLADMDGDGDLDVLVTRGVYDDATYEMKLGARVFLQGANGAFASQTQFVGATYGHVELADLDEDGDLDLIVTHTAYESTESLVNILRNDGSAFVESGETFGHGLEIREVLLADVDADGSTDLVLNRGSVFSVWLNAGTGAFEPESRRDYFAPADTRLLTLGDFDDDGDLDLATVASRVVFDPESGDYYPTNGRLVVIHSESGGFNAPEFTEMGLSPQLLLTADLDDDGDLDVISGNSSFYDAYLERVVSSVTILFNKGDGTFAPAITHMLPRDVVEISLADLDEDGDLDLTAVYGERDYYGYVTDYGVAVLLGNGDGTVDAPLVVAETIDDVFPAYVVGDFDKDGDLDVIRSGGIYDPDAGIDDRGIVALFGDGVGGFEDPVLLSNLGEFASAIALGDLDADGDLDVIASSSVYDPDTQTYDTRLRVLLSNGDGTFVAGTRLGGFVNSVHSLQLADVDDDADLDVIAVQSTYDSDTGTYASHLSFLRNNGAGTLSFGGNVDAGVGSYQLADMDGDGDLDVLATRGVYDDVTYTNELGARVYLQLANGTFAAGSEFIGGNAGRVQSADLDADGDLDLVVTSIPYGTSTRFVSVLINIGGTFEVAGATLGSAMGIQDVLLGDVDGDGKIDLLLDRGDSFSVLLNSGSAAFTDGVLQNYLASENGTRIALGDFDGDGDFDLASVSAEMLYDPYLSDFRATNGRLVVIRNITI